MSSLFFAIIVSIVCMVLLVYPFFAYGKEKLSASLSYNSLESMTKMKDGLLKRYIQDEKAHAAGELTASSWKSRRSFLVARYIDASRRLDFIENQKKQTQE